MTQTFAVDANNDLFIGADDRLAIVTGVTAVEQAAAQAAKTVLSEMVLATDQGLPYFEAVWVGEPNIGQFEVALRAAISAVQDVLSIASLTIDQTGEELGYSAEIQTIYGPGIVNG